MHNLTAFLAADLELVSTLKFIGLLVIAMAVFGFIGRAVFGSKSSLNQALSLAMGILCVYALTIVVYTFDPKGLSRFLAPLPFVTFRGESLHIFSIVSADFPAVCAQVLSMVVLAFLVNMMDGFMPKGKHLIGWFFYRFLTGKVFVMIHRVSSFGLFGNILPMKFEEIMYGTQTNYKHLLKNISIV